MSDDAGLIFVSGVFGGVVVTVFLGVLWTGIWDPLTTETTGCTATNMTRDGLPNSPRFYECADGWYESCERKVNDDRQLAWRCRS